MAGRQDRTEREGGKRGRRERTRVLLAVGLVLLMLAATLGCLADPFTGSSVVVDFLDDLEPSATVRLPDGSDSHYELWAQFEQLGVVSIGTFLVDGNLHVLTYPDGARRIGSVTGADDNRRSGVRFTSPADLTDASEAFVTLEPNGETDVAPSGVVAMSGALTSETRGELRGQMTGQYTNRLGQVLNPVARITIIIAEDNAFF